MILATMRDIPYNARMAEDLYVQADMMEVERVTPPSGYSERVRELLLAQPLNPLVPLAFKPIPRHSVGRSPLTVSALVLALVGCSSVPTWSEATACQRQAEFFKADQVYMQSAERQQSIRASADTVTQLKATLWTH